MTGVRICFPPRKNKALENLFRSRRNHRLRNLIRWRLYLASTRLPVNTWLPRKEAKNGPARLFSGKEPITFGDLSSWTQSDSWKLKHVTKIRDIAECSILKSDPKTQFVSCWFHWREEAYSKDSFKRESLLWFFWPFSPTGLRSPWRLFALRNESNSA